MEYSSSSDESSGGSNCDESSLSTDDFHPSRTACPIGDVDGSPLNSDFVARKKLIPYKSAFNYTKIFNGTDPIVSHTPVFQQVVEELCVSQALGLKVHSMVHKEHILMTSKLLHRYILNNEWENAAKAFIPVTQLPKILPGMLWRIGMELVQRMSGGQKHIGKFCERMLTLNPRNSSEIIITVLVFLLKNIDGVHNSQQFLVETSSKKSIVKDTMYELYSGIIYYLLWKLEVLRQVNAHADDAAELNEHGFSVMKARLLFKDLDVRSSQMDYFSVKALKHFEVLNGLPGVWDIFVTKCVDLHLFGYDDDKALSLLEAYLRDNPNNPNAYRYLYWFLVEMKGDNSKILHTLLSLSNIDPTGSPATVLLELLYAEGQVPKMVSLIFERLDRISCRNSASDWSWLCYVIAEDCKRGRAVASEAIQCAIDDRGTWWINFHFPCSRASQSSSSTNSASEDLLALKRYFVNVWSKTDVPQRVQEFMNHYDGKNPTADHVETEDMPTCVHNYISAARLRCASLSGDKRKRDDSTTSNHLIDSKRLLLESRDDVTS